jgi:pyruvate/2-oxoglutarate dehydrogenase complex dihydrolipoamide acyltransferase (E2) component
VTEVHNLAQQIQDQTVKSAQDFYGESIGQLKGQLQNDRAQLESLAEQVTQEEAQAQIQELVDSYTEIEDSLDQAAQDQGVEDTVSETVQQVQETAGQIAQGAQDSADGAAEQAQDTVDGAVEQAQEAVGGVTEQAQDAAGGATEGVGGALGQVTDQVGEVTQGVQDTAGQAVDQVGQTAENLAPGTQLLSQSTLDEAGNLLDEDLAGSVTDLPAEEEYTNEEGQTVRTVKEESGSLIRLSIGPDGDVLDLSIPKPSEEVTEEVVEEQSESQSETTAGQEPEATEAAKQRAEEMGVDLSQIEGSGAEGRITVKDVLNAHQE